MAKSTNPKPPSSLGRQGRALWRQVIEAFEIDDPHELALLGQAAAVLDTIAALEAVIADEGVTSVGSTNQRVAHPCVAEARQQRVVFARLVAALGLPARDGEQGVLDGYRARSAVGHKNRWSNVRELKRGTVARRRPPRESAVLDGLHGLRARLAKAERDIRRFCHGVCTHPVTSRNPPTCDHYNAVGCAYARRRVVRLRELIAEAEHGA